ncbi:MAG: ABATE domain-containing protein [Streptosporangiaceae bacterium]
MSQWSRVLAFSNSRLDGPAGVEDEMPDAAAAARWLAACFGVPAAAGRSRAAVSLDDADFRAALLLRSAVRSLIQARIAGHGPRPQDLEALNRSSARACRYDLLTSAWDRDTRYAGSPGLAGGSPRVQLASLASDAIALLSTPAVDLTECAADDCVVLFERTDPRRRWHSDRCGNRVRAARSYARRHGEPG